MKKGIAIASSIVCILVGLLFGLIFLLIINPAESISLGFTPLILAGLSSAFNPDWISAGSNLMKLGQEIANAMPIIMTGLSVAFAFKMGLFNIGAAGQYTLGAFGALYFALILKCPWYVCLLAAAAFGAFWGMLPGLLKAYLNINEVISCIMLNWIGLYGVNTIIYGNGNSKMFNSSQSKAYQVGTVNPDALIPSKIFGLDMFEIFKYRATTIGIFFAIIIAIVILIVLNKTTFGYELKACGFNKDAAKYAGINDKRNIILSMLISGALAGFGAGLFYLSGTVQWNPLDSTALPAAGFDGITVALLGLLNPIGCIFSGLFISHISVGGTMMPQSIFPSEISQIITGLIVYLCAFTPIIQEKLTKFIGAHKKTQQNANKEEK
ncbi:ABC transporter permease [Lachnobacterium bovis]|uniref:Simple sugar transport system permease protein n=1 Tax=Lachnobacterium bovis TaxID=140626 RepID=A0A1H9PV07_9FIRM|nr:ABC transporter permease [Lachnobacterium bovis]SER52051.1 simple sugar transport system permease protein [Lachnobacterium bovis]